MDDLASLRERINSYADYADVDSRHLTDQQIRAYLGERLSALRERLAPAVPAAEQLERVLLRCEFTDQQVVRAADHALLADGEVVGRIHAFDRKLVDAGDRAATVDVSDLPALLDEIEAVFDQRTGAFTSAPSR